MKLLQDVQKNFKLFFVAFLLEATINKEGRDIGLKLDAWLDALTRSSSRLMLSTSLFFRTSLLS